jgi:hypothetical protein
MQRTKVHLLGASDIAINPFMNSLLRAAANQVSPLKLGLLPSEERYPQLAAWMQRLERNPGYERTTADREPNAPRYLEFDYPGSDWVSLPLRGPPRRVLSASAKSQ